jgi:hypothetical protein
MLYLKIYNPTVKNRIETTFTGYCVWTFCLQRHQQERSQWSSAGSFLAVAINKQIVSINASPWQSPMSPDLRN